MARITDFTQYRLKTGDLLSRDKAIEALAALSVLQALEDITQEINATTQIYCDAELFPDANTRRERMTTAVKMFTNGRTYNLQQLLYMHAANLYKTADSLTPYITEPPAAEKLELRRQKEDLMQDYVKARKPIVSKYLLECVDAAKLDAKKLRQLGSEETKQDSAADPE